jgi:hypothetical protein
MARIHPDGWRKVPAEGALAREIETLTALAGALPDDCSIWHGVHWTRVQREHTLVGEVDFIVVGPGGRLLLIEQKSGFLDETPDGLVKNYSRSRKNVSAQLARNADHLRARLRGFLDGRTPLLDTLLYCPDYTVRQPGTAGIDPARIVDAGRRDQLPAIVLSLLRSDAPEPTLVEEIERFLADELQLVPEVNAIVGQAESLYTRLSGGLAEWARRIDMTPFRLRVTGTAGSGKTQLAMAVFRDAIDTARRPLYVCYNRPLADHISLIAPKGGEVTTYHQLCVRMLRDAGHQPDFSRPGAFGEVERLAAALTPPERWRFDEIIIDEGQDFRESWRDHLLGLLQADGRAWWLEDPMQNLYDRPTVSLPGWVGISSQRNYRSPADIVETLNQMLALPEEVEPGSPLTGSDLELLTWEDARGLIDATKRTITRAIGLGFKRQHIALVTFRGREHSVFTPYDRLGPHSLRAFTGRYDLLGNPEFTDGEVLIDSVHRFKGQAAPCVIFTEIDFDTLDERTRRKLFVGATRASMKLIMVMSERVAASLRSTQTLRTG